VVLAPLVVVGLVPGLLGVLVLLHVLRGVGDAAAVLRIQRVPVRSVPDELGRSVVLSGRARTPASGETLRGPVSGSDALVVEHAVDERRADDGYSTWHRVDDRRASVPFVLDDGTASVRVDPRTATLSLGTDDAVHVAAGEAVPDRLRGSTTDPDADADPRPLDRDAVTLTADRARRFTERRLRPDDDVTVVGRPTPTLGGDGAVNAIVDSGNPFVVADATPRTVARRLAVEWGLYLAGGVVLSGLGVVVVYGGLVVG
jgi:hypothetical protein